MDLITIPMLLERKLFVSYYIDEVLRCGGRENMTEKAMSLIRNNDIVSL